MFPILFTLALVGVLLVIADGSLSAWLTLLARLSIFPTRRRQHSIINDYTVFSVLCQFAEKTAAPEGAAAAHMV